MFCAEKFKLSGKPKEIETHQGNESLLLITRSLEPNECYVNSLYLKDTFSILDSLINFISFLVQIVDLDRFYRETNEPFPRQKKSSGDLKTGF